MEKLVQVAEQEVQIDFNLGCKCRAKIHLKSLSPTTPVAFKVQTSAPHKFLVSPPNGLIPPAASTSFLVILKPQNQVPPSFPKSPSDRFLIKTALAPDLESNGNDNSDNQLNTWFSSSARTSHDIKLKVVYVGPFLLRHAVSAGDVDAIKHIVKRQKSLLLGLSPREAAALLETAPNAEMLDLLAGAGLGNHHPVDGKEEEDEMASKGWTPLHVAAISGGRDVLERLLVENEEKGRLECRDKRGRTPLHLAASKGQLWCVRRLVEAGAEANAESEDGRTALFRAAENGDSEMVALLLEVGADASIAAEDVAPVDVAQEKGHANVVEILQRGEQVLTAARRGEIDRLKSLLEKKPGCFVNFCDQYGLTALHSAAIKGHADIVTMLTEFGMDVESRDIEGHTPLHLAVEGGSREAVEALIDRGANVNARSKRGATPLYMATMMGYENISQILKIRGASPACLPSSSSSVSSASVA